jgi:DHA1 family bicyclomycin/chloramphenicol resistance-like MFS transporter
VGVVAGVQLSSFIMRRTRIGPQWILSCTTVAMAAMALTIAALDVAGAGLWGTLIPLWFFIAGCGFNIPCVQVLALSAHGREAGTAASLLGAANFGVAGLFSPVAGLFGVSNAVPMAIVMAATAVISIASLWLIVRPRQVPQLAH